tara:strand:+ start:661 stop:1428 length:768 start_codon:yes stop_codon:yes gene_type:complete
MSNDVFAKHGIEHLSVSHVNTFITEPAKWCAKYLFGMQSDASPAAFRGTVVDEAIGVYLSSEKPSKKNCTNVAMKRYRALSENAGLDPHEEKNSKERHLVPHFFNCAAEFYDTFGKPTSYQEQITMDVGLSVPMIGFIDLRYEGIVRDIKTVGRMPNEVPNTVKRQLSLYATATDCLPIVDYICVSKTKADVKSVVIDDVEANFDDLLRGAKAIERVLSIGDKNEIADMYFPNLDSWMWSDKEKLFAKSIWSKNE